MFVCPNIDSNFSISSWSSSPAFVRASSDLFYLFLTRLFIYTKFIYTSFPFLFGFISKDLGDHFEPKNKDRESNPLNLLR